MALSVIIFSEGFAKNMLTYLGGRGSKNPKYIYANVIYEWSLGVKGS